MIKSKIGRNYKTNYWELFYPDGTSLIMNYNPFKELTQMLEKVKHFNSYLDCGWKYSSKETQKIVKEIRNDFNEIFLSQAFRKPKFYKTDGMTPEEITQLKKKLFLRETLK